MADHNHHHHQQHRPNRLSVPSRTGVTVVGRAYASFPYTPTPTPSKTRLSRSSHGNTKSSISFLFLILFSLRSLYSLLPFLRSSPSFSLFPFSFLVSLLSFLFSLAFSLFSSFSRQNRPVFSLKSLSLSQFKLLLSKSLLLSVVFLLRFQALRYCGAAAMILAELSGNVSARVLSEAKNRISNGIQSSKIRGFCILFAGLLLLSISWDRIDCFPFSSSSIQNWGFWFNPNCTRFWPMLLPFLSGFLACYEKVSMNSHEIKQLDQKRVRLLSLFLTTVLLFFPALVSFMLSNENGVSFGTLSWPLANTVVFGVLLSENYSEEKFRNSKDTLKEFLVTFLCTIVLELFYFPELSLWGLLFCGFLLYVAVRELDSVSSDYQEIGMESSESSISTMFMKPIRHILSEKKSRKIALFLLINTGYMVVEFVAGFMSNSLGLISDACHMLFDCAALAIGLYASYISRLPANHQFNYGRSRFEVLSGYVNAVFLVLVGALIVLESIERILDPQEISTNSLLVVSVGGLLVNVVGLVFFHEEHHHAHGGSGCSHSHNKHEIHKDHETILLHNGGIQAARRLGNDHNHGQENHDCSHGHGNDQHSHEVSHGHGHGHEHHSQVIDHSDGNGHHSHDGTCGHRHDHHSHDGSQNHGHDHHNRDHSHEVNHIQGHAHDHHSQDINNKVTHDHQSQYISYKAAHDHQKSQDISHKAGHDQQSQDIGHKAEHDHSSQYISYKAAHDHQKSQNISHKAGHDLQSQDISHKAKRDHHGQDVSHEHHGHGHHSHKPGHDHGQDISHRPDHDHHSNECSHNHGHGHEDHTHSNHNQQNNKKQHHHIDHNMEGIFLHVLADTMGSVGVVISTLLIKYKGWLVADPASSIFISILIIASVIPLLRNSAEILLQRVPKPHEHSLKEAMKKILKTKGVCSIQRLHVWSLTNSEIVATLHLQVSMDSDKIMDTKLEVSKLLEDAGVKDLTLQVESVDL